MYEEFHRSFLITYEYVVITSVIIFTPSSDAKNKSNGTYQPFNDNLINVYQSKQKSPHRLLPIATWLLSQSASCGIRELRRDNVVFVDHSVYKSLKVSCTHTNIYPYSPIKISLSLFSASCVTYTCEKWPPQFPPWVPSTELRYLLHFLILYDSV